ncbi:MAG: hypothetical protein WBD16_10695 [Pyrinomonadaceae bacterium]
MRSKLRYIIIATVLGLLLQNAASAQGLDVKFPEIDGWEKGELTKYPSAALGYSIGYESETGEIVTVYVYNAGLKTIPDDVNHKTIKDEINRAKAEIRQVEEMGYYENVKELKNDTVTLGGEAGKVKTLHALFTFKLRGNEVASDIFIWGYQNHFVKIRATRKAEKEMVNSKIFTVLLAELDKLFSKPPAEKLKAE